MNKLIPIALALLLFPAAANAHGDTPLPIDLSGVGDNDWVLRTNFGIVTSAQPDRYVCEEAFAGGFDFQVAALGVDEWLLFTRSALVYSPDGCDFEIRQQLAKKPAGVATSPARTRAAYLVNADEPAEDGIWWTQDAAQTVEQAAFDASSLQLTRAKFVDESRLVVSAYSNETDTSGQARLILVDLDAGSSEVLPGLVGLSHPYVFDVEAEWVVWLARDDAGQQTIFWGPLDEPTRHSTAVDSWPSGARLSEDGQVVWLSGVQEGAQGVMVGDTSQDPVWSERFGDHSALCIGRVGEAYHLCGRRDREGYDLGRVVGEGTLEPVVEFTQLAGPRDDCPAGSDVASTCPSVWPELAPALGIEVDGSSGDAGWGEPSEGEQKSDGGGCSVAEAKARKRVPSAAIVFLVLAIGLRWAPRSSRAAANSRG